MSFCICTHIVSSISPTSVNPFIPNLVWFYSWDVDVIRFFKILKFYRILVFCLHVTFKIVSYTSTLFTPTSCVWQRGYLSGYASSSLSYRRLLQTVISEKTTVFELCYNILKQSKTKSILSVYVNNRNKLFILPCNLLLEWRPFHTDLLIHVLFIFTLAW